MALINIGVGGTGYFGDSTVIDGGDLDYRRWLIGIIAQGYSARTGVDKLPPEECGRLAIQQADWILSTLIAE